MPYYPFPIHPPKSILVIIQFRMQVKRIGAYPINPKIRNKMKTRILIALLCAIFTCPAHSQTGSNTTQTDSISLVLLQRIEKLIAPIPLKIIFWCDSVPASFHLLGKVSFADAFSGFRENDEENTRLGFIKSKSADVNIFFFAKISEQVEIYTIKSDVTLVEFSSLGETPGAELNPTKILTLRTLSENNLLRFDEIIFHTASEHFKYLDNQWLIIE